MTERTCETQIEQAYLLAQESYAALGVDTERALARLAQVALSLHCWQGDDVAASRIPGGELGGGIAATGNYPGKARNGRRAAPATSTRPTA